jgi:histidinol dehydrogenase
VENVRQKGNSALLEYTKKFDGINLRKEDITVKPEEIQEALDSLDRNLLDSLKTAYDRIYEFHTYSLPKTFLYEDKLGNILGEVVKPVRRAGLYIPGGKASYPSTVLMTAVPAKAAGVAEIYMCIPPQKNGKINPATLAAASLVNPTAIFKVGGAQAIAAMAFGTETIPAVDVIAGPGNIFVACAKKEVYGICGIDMIAGPSEVAIIADDTSNPRWTAYDLMAQAEHDPNASAFLISTSQEFIEKVITELKELVPASERSHIIRESLENNCLFIYANNVEEAFEAANLIAPEHLEIKIENAHEYLHMVESAGAVFLGSLTAESFGDYILGPNHTLPTQATARFASPLSAKTFLKTTNVCMISKRGVLDLYPHLERIAKSEGLPEHLHSARERFRDIKKMK